MSDEAAFLDTLKANPADDTARLVYADWLDEYGDEQRATYLRAVVDLTALAGGTPAYTDAAVRLFTAAVGTDAAWRSAAGGRFDLVLDGYESSRKIHTIKVIREVTGIGLAGAKAFSESVPVPLFTWQPFEALLDALLRFDGCAAAGVRPTPWPGGDGRDTVFDVVLKNHTISLEPHDEYGEGLVYDYAVYGIAHTLGLTPEVAADRLRSLPLTLGTGITAAAVSGFLRDLKMRCNAWHQFSPGGLQVIARPAT